MNNQNKGSLYDNYQDNNNVKNNINNNVVNQSEQPYRVENVPKSKRVLRVIMIMSFIATIVLVGGFALVYTGVIKVSHVGPKAILLNASNIGVKKGRDYQFDYQVYPESSTAKNVYYESSDPSVADVNRLTGYVTPIKEGTTTISIRSTDDDTVIEKSNISVTKEKVAINDIKLSSERIVFDLSNKATSQLLKVFTEPYNATNQDLSFESSDSSVAIVDQSGRVYPVGFGMATIAVRAKDGNASATCEVIVTDSKNKKVYFELPDKTKLVFPYSIQLDTNYLKLKYGTSRKVGFILLPPDVTEDVVTWISSDPTVATVNEGVIFGNAIGNTTITARTVNDLVATLTVDVTDDETTSDYVEFRDDTDEIAIGETKRLNISYDPNASVANFEFTSSNPDVISVDSEGNITAYAKGSATITVKPGSGSGVQPMASKIGDTIVIKADGIETPNYITVTESAITIGTGETRQLEVESDTGNDNFKYQSLNQEVATVNENGIIYGVKVGTAEIKISATNGVSTTITVNVSNVEASNIVISEPSGTTIKKGDLLDLNAEIWPKNATEKTITWTSSNPNVASVNEAGVVKAIAIGQTTITAVVGTQSNSIVIKVAADANNNETLKPSKLLSDIQIEQLQKTPIIFKREGDKQIQVTLDLENQGFVENVTLNKTTFKIINSGVDKTVKNLKIQNIKGMPLSKNLTFAADSYGKITVQATVYLTENKKTITIESAEYTIGEDINVEFNVPVGNSLSLGSYFTVNEAFNVTDWTNTNPEVASIKDGYVEGLKVGSTYITGHSKGYTFIGKVNVIDEDKEENTDKNFTFIYDACYAATDLCSVGTLKSTTLKKNTTKCSSEKPYYVASQKTKYEFVCQIDKKKTETFTGLSTYSIIDKELIFDHASSSNISKGETQTIKIKNWDKLNLASATVHTSIDNSIKTIKNASFAVSVPAKAEAKSVTITVEAKTKDKNPKVYKGVLVLNVSEEFVPNKIECENSNKLTIVEGKDKVLSCSLIDKFDPTIKQAITTNDNPTYKSSNEKIIKIDTDGKIVALKKGEATITVKARNLKAVKVKVTVEKAPPIYKNLDVTLKKGKNNTSIISVGDKNLTLGYTLSTEDKKTKKSSGLSVTFTSSNPEVLTIEDNIVTPVAAGKSTITATYINEDATSVTGTLEVTVTEKPANITQLDCGPTMSLIKGGDSATIDCSAYDSSNDKKLGVLDKIFTYSVADKSIVTIDSATGVVTPIKKGTTTITVKAQNKSAKIKVTVRTDKATYEDVKFTNMDNVEIKVGDTYDVQYELVISDTEKDTVSPNVKITSSNSKVVVVKDNKQLVAKAQGSATITISYTNPGAKNSLSKKAKVTIYEIMPVCYRYKKVTEGGRASCDDGYGYNGSDKKNCYKIDTQITTKAACNRKTQHVWTNGYCIDQNDRYANEKTKLVDEKYTYTSKETKTNGQQYDASIDKLENVCHNSCSEAGCNYQK